MAQLFKGEAMRKLLDGIFAADGIMPCRPEEIKVFRYGFPRGTLIFDYAESAARLIVFSQQFGCWVGVSLAKLMDEVHGEIAAQKLAAETRRIDENEKAMHAEELKRYQRMQSITFGLYSFLKNPPKPAKILSVPRPRTVSNIWLAGPQHVLQGFKGLLDEEFLSLEVVEGNNILFPTFKLVSEIIDRQNAFAA